MLDAISDFWKPAKKNQGAETVDPAELQLETSIGFGFVPQASLSGRRLYVTGVQTYKFGEENLTSFLLAPEKHASNPHVSMIIAEADEEQYLAISRRIGINDRMKLFNTQDLEKVVEDENATKLACKDGTPDFKGWTVASYTREMQKMTGYLFKDDYRGKSLPSLDVAQEFKYTLLVSENNEHAIEIEKYKDGRMEVYATIYRRIGDIGEVVHPSRPEMVSRPDLKLASTDTPEPETAEEKPQADAQKKEEQLAAPAAEQEEKKEAAMPPVQKEPVAFKELKKEEPKKAEIRPEPKPVEPPEQEPKIEAKQPIQPQQPIKKEEKSNMATYDNNMNGAFKEKDSGFGGAAAVVGKAANMSGESVECELKVANRIIDEAIRNEMRLSDVVRKIVELPVAQQEMVHLPISLSDEDYALLAIRYGIPASDKNAIRAKIIEDLGSFSGKAA